jgi:hypothetical protein
MKRFTVERDDRSGLYFVCRPDGERVVAFCKNVDWADAVADALSEKFGKDPRFWVDTQQHK